MSKSIDIMVKNLKLFVRDRKVLLITLLVPIMFYTIMGVTFGSNTYSELNLSQYSLGFVNLDVNGEQAYNPYQSAEFIIDTISSNETEQDSSNLFSLEKNYTITDENGEVDANASVEAAEAAITAGNITTFITFDQGFQQRLNEKITILIGLYDNGTSDANPYIGNLTRGLIENQQPYVVVNLSQSNFMGIKEDMNETDFDYLVSVNNDLNLTLFYREGMLQENLDLFTYEFQTYCGTLLTHMDAHPAINITKRLLEGVQVQPNPSYSMHFLQSVDPTTKSIMTQTVNGIISSVINFDATEITMNSTTENVQGVVLNAITTGAPGYYLYGMLAILSFATTILAQESKEGLLRRLKSTRMKDSQLLMGNFLANTVILLIQFGVATGVMALFGLNPYFHDIGTLILGTLLNIIAISFFLNSLAFFLTPIFKSPEAAGGGVWVILIPLMMFSGAFFPLEVVSPGLVGPARYIPARMSVLAFQGILVDGLSLSNPKIWVNLLGQIAYGLFFFMLGIRMFKKFTEKSRMRKKKQKNDNKEVKTNKDKE